MKKTIRIKLTRSEIIALFQITIGYLYINDPVGYGAMITKELMVEVADRMDAMLNNLEQRKYTLRISGAQSMAFVAFWTKIDLTKTPYERIIINKAIEKIHQANLYANIFSH